MNRGKHKNHIKGSHHYRWNDALIDSMGYKLLRLGRKHPLADPNGYAREHLVVWLSAGFPPLLLNEVLHHKNGDKKDNRIENLKLMTREAHNILHKLQRNSKTGRFIGKKAAGLLGGNGTRYPK